MTILQRVFNSIWFIFVPKSAWRTSSYFIGKQWLHLTAKPIHATLNLSLFILLNLFFSFHLKIIIYLWVCSEYTMETAANYFLKIVRRICNLCKLLLIQLRRRLSMKSTSSKLRTIFRFALCVKKEVRGNYCLGWRDWLALFVRFFIYLFIRQLKMEKVDFRSLCLLSCRYLDFVCKYDRNEILRYEL